MISRRFPIFALLLWSFLSHRIVSAQTPPDLTIVSMDAVLKGSNKFIDVFFSQPLDAAHGEDLVTTGITVEALPSKTALTVVAVKRLGGDPTELEFSLSGDAAPSDVQVRLTINRTMNFRDGQDTRAANGPFTFTSTLVKDSRTLQDAMQKLVDDMTRAGKSSQEKNIFASGFVTTGGETQGGADISLNSLNLGVPGLTSFMVLRKTTADGSDPKNFEVGATFRATFLRGEAGRSAIQKALNAYRTATSDSARQQAATQYNAAVVDFQKATIAATFLDVAGKLEGQATNFNVTNGVAEVSVKVQSRVKGLFGKEGFFHFQLLPLGFEGGATLRDPDSGITAPLSPVDQALQQLDGIVRLKAGGTLNAFWQNPRPVGALRRFEIELGVVDRYLFLNEIHYDIATKTNSIIRDGNRYYAHADAKVFVAESNAGRYGFKISYNRGSLPPVYAPVKSFQFGFLYESTN